MNNCKPLPVLLSVAAGLGLMGTSNAQYSLTLFHHNDGESQLLGNDADSLYGGIDRFVSLAAQQRSLYESMNHGVLMVSAGDNFLPGREFAASLSTGELGSRTYYDAIAQAQIDYDAFVVGNHDMDLGPELLADYIRFYRDSGGDAPWLSSNLDVSNDENLSDLVSSSTISTVDTSAGSKRIGIIGATTENLPFISSPGDDIVISSVVDSVQAEVNRLRDEEGVDHVILLSHLQGLDTDREVLTQISGLDLAIAGGGDEFLYNGTPVDGVDTVPGQGDPIGPYPTDVEGSPTVLVTAPGDYGYLGRITLEFDAEGNLVSANGNPIVVKDESLGGVEGDSLVQSEVVDPVAEFVAALDSNVIGGTSSGSPAILEGTSNTVRSRETNAGNLVADAYLSAARSRAESFGVKEPDIALANGGGIRNGNLSLTDNGGGITEGDTFSISPFSNVVTVVEDISASDFKLLLENAYSRLVINEEGQIVRRGDGTGRFAQLSSGADLIVDVSQAPLVLDEQGNVVSQGSRIRFLEIDGREIIINGKPVEGETITLALPDFLARGGDQYFFFDTDGDNETGLDEGDFTSLGITDQQALAEFIEETLAGDISADEYQENPADRITLATAPVIFQAVNQVAIDSFTFSALPSARAQATIARTSMRAGLNDVNSRLFRLRTGLHQAQKANMSAQAVLFSAKGSSAKGGPVESKIAPPEMPRFSMYGEANYANQEFDNLFGSQDGLDIDSYGGTIGWEYLFSDKLAGGVAFSFLRSDAQVDGVFDTDADGFLVTPYLTWVDANWYADVLYSYGRFSHDIDRIATDGSRVGGNTNSDNHRVELNLGYSFDVAEFRMGPYAGAAYQQGTIDGYSESRGQNGLRAYFDEQEYSSFDTRLGWQISRQFEMNNGWRFTPELRVGWEYEYTDDEDSLRGGLTQAPVTVIREGEVIGSQGYEVNDGGADSFEQHYAVVGVGMQWEFDNQLSLGADYEGKFSDDSERHFVKLSLNYTW